MNTEEYKQINSIREMILQKLQDENLIQEAFAIINSVKADPRKAVMEYYAKKGIARTHIEVSQEEIQVACSHISKEDLQALKQLQKRVKAIAQTERKGLNHHSVIRKMKHFSSEIHTIPLETIGIYIPMNLPSSLILYCELAQFAGVKNIILALPPGKDGRINPALLAAASLFSFAKIIAIGGKYAFPALAFGAGGDIPDKLFGPCSLYVDQIKQILSTFYKVPIDIPSGPSEMVIFTDNPASLEQTELDCRAQMEHGSDSIAFIVSTEKDIITCIEDKTKDLENQIKCIYVEDIQKGIEVINAIAPEILEIFSDAPEQITTGLKSTTNAYVNMCSALGDYLSAGKGCADPTYGMARGVSGITLDSFYKTSCITYGKSSRPTEKWITRLPRLEKFPYHILAIEKYLSSTK